MSFFSLSLTYLITLFLLYLPYSYTQSSNILSFFLYVQTILGCYIKLYNHFAFLHSSFFLSSWHLDEQKIQIQHTYSEYILEKIKNLSMLKNTLKQWSWKTINLYSMYHHFSATSQPFTSLSLSFLLSFITFTAIQYLYLFFGSKLITLWRNRTHPLCDNIILGVKWLLVRQKNLFWIIFQYSLYPQYLG